MIRRWQAKSEEWTKGDTIPIQEMDETIEMSGDNSGAVTAGARQQ